MNLDVFLVADYANIELFNKLNVMGIFNQIYAAKFPTIRPEMYLVMKFSISPMEFGETRRLTVKLMDEDGGQILEWANNIKLPDKSPAPWKNDINYILRLANTVFPKPGVYQFSVLVDRDEKDTYSIIVNKIEELLPKLEG